MTKVNETAKYSQVLKNWQTKLYGPKPSLELFKQAHALGCRAGKQALAMAMYLRPDGATNGQVVAAVTANWGTSGTHHNIRRHHVEIKNVKLVPKPDSANGHTVYAIELTAKGLGKVTKVIAPAKPEKAKAEPAPQPAQAEPAQPQTM